MSLTGTNSQTFFVGGPSTNGTLIQMAACGIMIAALTGAPSLTFWRYRYLQYTNFAMLSIVQSFDGQVAYGQTSTCKIYKAGDLLYFLYIVLQLPGIRACPARGGGCGPTQQFPYAIDANNPCVQTDSDYFTSLDQGVQGWLYSNYGSCGDYEEDCVANTCVAGTGQCDTDPWAHYVNAVGQFILKRVTLIIGTQTIDTLYNDYLFMWEELAGKPGKRLTEMVGKYYCRDDLIVASQATRTLYVPLPFYFTQTPGNALPLVAIMFAGASLVVEFEQLQNVVVVSGPDLQVVKCNGGGPLGQGDIRAAVDGTQIFLDVLERDRFASTWFEQLITQVSALYTSVCCASARIPLNFAFCVIELIWAVRRKCQEKSNNWFNYSGILGKEPLVSVEIDFNSTARQQMREASWYRLVQNYQYHTLIPDASIYTYSFALYPEEAQPSGCANFSRLESVTMLIQLQDGLESEDVTVIIFSRSFNMLKFRDGVAGLAFSS
jgi:hypothetical protein